MIEVEDVTRDPGEHGRPATAQDPANRATFPEDVMVHTVAPEAPA
jgi:hypothetical protein